jgi:RNA polymerase sigma factor (sigma-70 family)
MLGSFGDAEDAVQDTLLSAWQRLSGFEERASLRTWLYRIATNRCLNALRSASRRPAEAWDIPEVEPPGPTRPRRCRRTGIINQIRAFLLERGVAVRQGLRFLRAELPRILATNRAGDDWPDPRHAHQALTAGIMARKNLDLIRGPVEAYPLMSSHAR